MASSSQPSRRPRRMYSEPVNASATTTPTTAASPLRGRNRPWADGEEEADLADPMPRRPRRPVGGGGLGMGATAILSSPTHRTVSPPPPTSASASATSNYTTERIHRGVGGGGEPRSLPPSSENYLPTRQTSVPESFAERRENRRGSMGSYNYSSSGEELDPGDDIASRYAARRRERRKSLSDSFHSEDGGGGGVGGSGGGGGGGVDTAERRAERYAARRREREAQAAAATAGVTTMGNASVGSIGSSSAGGVCVSLVGV